MPDLIVKAGTTQIIDATTPLADLYDNVIMEDNATIIAKVNIKISARSARFGNNCLIDGSGRDGANGADQTYVPPQAGQLDSGYHGRDGGNGTPGTRGVNITLDVVLAAQPIGSLTIKSHGGRGGNGGAGGIGGMGGDATCLGGNGGSGGNGGNGGNAAWGQDAGQITFGWSSSGGATASVESIPAELVIAQGRSAPLVFAAPPGLNIEHIQIGGQGGRGGARGPGGRGGDGVSCLGYNRGGGGPGGWGYPGQDGRNGNNTTSIIIQK